MSRKRTARDRLIAIERRKARVEKYGRWPRDPRRLAAP